MIYAGIGARETPKDILFKMESFGSALARMGFVLRSGGAPGADSAFERGCFRAHGEKEIFLPWRNFNNNPSNYTAVSKTAMELARDVWNETRGGNFKKLKRPVRLLMGRNAYQILGPTLDNPCKLVICWTADGCETAADRTNDTGGTGQAIAHASLLGIEVFNLRNEGREDDLFYFLGDLYGEDS